MKKDTDIPALMVPYRLCTLEDVLRAKDVNLLKLKANDFAAMRECATRHTLHLPPALRKAKEMVSGAFHTLKQERLTERRVENVAQGDLRLIDSFAVVQERLPWIREIVRHDDFASFLDVFMHGHASLRNKDAAEPEISEMLQTELRARKFLKDQILSYVRTGRGTGLDGEGLREVLSAYVLFEGRNADVLEALRMSSLSGDDVLYQNAVAELLFSRIERFMREITYADPRTIRQKVVSWIMRHDIPGPVKASLIGYVKIEDIRKDPLESLGRVSRIAEKTLRDADMAKRFGDFLASLSRNIEILRNGHRKVMLTRELMNLQHLYVPRSVLQTKVTYIEEIVREFTVAHRLDFYPTKDYLDLLKGAFSRDCTGIGVGEKQLCTKEFFNIRTFRGREWVGNIYVLDFTRKMGVIMIDRIQAPRSASWAFIDLFETLVKVLQEMFRDVPYRQIVISDVVSNHETVQKAFNSYKKSLKKTDASEPLPQLKAFESLGEKRQHYVLVNRSDNK